MKVSGCIIESDCGFLTKEGMRGVWCDHENPKEAWVHPISILKELPKVYRQWEYKPIRIYPATYDPTQHITEVEKSFDFYTNCMIGKVYNTKQGIKLALTSLDDFMELVSERQDAGYKRKERLDEFYVFGRYYMDSCGNCGKITEWIPKEKMPDIPDVMTKNELWEYVKAHVDNVDNVWISSDMNSELPYDGVICPVCKKGWTIHNCHDTVVVSTTEVFPLNNFVGKTLGEVKGYYSAKVDARYLMQNDILIRNDKHIDLTPNPDYSSLKKNKKGWVGAKEGITNDYVIQRGDDGYFNVWKYYHGECNCLNLAFKEEEQFRNIFKAAGFNIICLHHIPNKYCSCDRCAPWFRVETEVGTITTGWRKRVISIDWSEAPHGNKNTMSLFEKEDATKGDCSIHARGWDKATEYLSKLYKTLST